MKTNSINNRISMVNVQYTDAAGKLITYDNAIIMPRNSSIILNGKFTANTGEVDTMDKRALNKETKFVTEGGVTETFVTDTVYNFANGPQLASDENDSVKKNMLSLIKHDKLGTIEDFSIAKSCLFVSENETGGYDTMQVFCGELGYYSFGLEHLKNIEIIQEKSKKEPTISV